MRETRLLLAASRQSRAGLGKRAAAPMTAIDATTRDIYCTPVTRSVLIDGQPFASEFY